jgi:DNA invertase Pin-like site-specific DNA recombinase
MFFSVLGWRSAWTGSDESTAKVSADLCGDRRPPSRALKDVLHIMERIAQAGAGFRSITENIDTTTPAGRMMMQMIGSFAELERATIRE